MHLSFSVMLFLFIFFTWSAQNKVLYMLQVSSHARGTRILQMAACAIIYNSQKAGR